MNEKLLGKFMSEICFLRDKERMKENGSDF